MLFLKIFYLIISNALASNYQITLDMQTTLSIPSGFQILQSNPINQYLFCLLASNTQFQVQKYIFLNNQSLALSDQSPLFNAYINLTQIDDLNPQLFIYQQNIITMFKTNSSLGGNRVVLSYYSLQSYNLTVLPYYYIGI